ncbi:MAG: hypothetical protein VKL39_16665 [Leptolyngbyaceae bacterium]|nr:hypothetical protein [Leptolyngbyaceae bacterium]
MWITIRTTQYRWEADLMQQILVSHDIPARVVNQGIAPHFGCGVPAAVQVPPQHQWTALLLISPIEDSGSEPMEH